MNGQITSSFREFANYFENQKSERVEMALFRQGHAKRTPAWASKGQGLAKSRPSLQLIQFTRTSPSDVVSTVYNQKTMDFQCTAWSWPILSGR